MSFLEGLLWFGLGWILATYWWRWALREALEQLMASDQFRQQLRRETQGLITMKIELVGNQVMCYNATNNEFICQGSNIDEVMENFLKRYPSHTGVLTADDNDTEARAWIKRNRASIGQSQES